MPFIAMQMDLEIIILSEVKSERERQITYVYVNLKYDTNDLIYETEANSQTQKTNLCFTMQRAGEGEINQDISIYKLLYIKELNNQVPLYSTANCIQNFIKNHNGKK